MSRMQKKIVLLCGLSSYVIHFRMGLIAALQSRGLKVSVVAFDEENAQEIKNAGADFYCLEDSNRGVNVFKVLSLKKRYVRLIKEINPDYVFTFMLKPNIFGTLAAKSLGITQIYSMVEGAGDVFINQSLMWRGIRFLVTRFYKQAFKYSQKVFFLNDEDKKEFIDRGLVKDKQAIIVRGIGVDLQKFQYKPLKDDASFLMIARMLKTKGVMEYCKAAKIVKSRYAKAKFCYLGAEGSIKLSDIQDYIDTGIIEYLGTTEDVRPYLEACAVYVLPSYREGLPMSIMEAEAVGRAIVTTASIGCKDTVKEGYNGYLVGLKNEYDLAEKLMYFLENSEEIVRMGENSRCFAEEYFDQDKINAFICNELGIYICKTIR